jgi:hypothetical protein
MKTKSILILIILFSITFSFSAIGQKSNFSGEWKLNKEKTVLADSRLFLSKVTIQLKSDSLLTSRVYENENGEQYPFTENLSLDGKECKMSIYEMPRVTKASRSNSNDAINIESTTTFYGDNGEVKLIAKETWNVDNEGNTLTIIFTNKMAENESAGTSYYNKVKSN